MNIGDMSFLESAPWKFDAKVTMKAPPSKVWAALVDDSSWPTWFQDCTSCRSTSIPSGGVDSTRSIVVGPLSVDERFIAWEEERLWAFTALGINKRFASMLVECVRLAPGDDGGTDLSYRMAANPTWWAKPMHHKFESNVISAWTTSLQTLDAQLLAAVS